MKALLILTALALAGLAGEAGRRSFTKEQLKARYWFDLGPSEIDVSAYPEIHRQVYGVFTETCAACHTAARPINAPITSRRDWRRYVQRMHVRNKVKKGEGFLNEEAGLIVDFLVYDSQVRKVKAKAEFQARSEELKKLYEEMLKIRGQAQAEEGRRRAKPQPMYTGEDPRAQ